MVFHELAAVPEQSDSWYPRLPALWPLLDKADARLLMIAQVVLSIDLVEYEAGFHDSGLVYCIPHPDKASGWWVRSSVLLWFASLQKSRQVTDLQSFQMRCYVT